MTPHWQNPQHSGKYRTGFTLCVTGKFPICHVVSLEKVPGKHSISGQASISMLSKIFFESLHAQPSLWPFVSEATVFYEHKI